MSYAQETKIDVTKTRAQIEQLVLRHGADSFIVGYDRGHAMVQFRMEERIIRFRLTMPDPTSRAFTETPSGKWGRSEQQACRAWEQACKAKWRALLLVIKAKLEAIDEGIAAFDEEFLSHIVLPGDQTVGDYVLPVVTEAYETGQLPSQLLALPAPDGAAR